MWISDAFSAWDKLEREVSLQKDVRKAPWEVRGSLGAWRTLGEGVGREAAEKMKADHRLREEGKTRKAYQILWFVNGGVTYKST